MPETRAPEAALLSDLAEQLAALASVPRLALLHALRTPHELHDIRIAAEGSGRPLSRQTVTHHIEHLQRLGLVRSGPDGPGGATTYLLDHARLFALVDDLRQLARIRPLVTRDAVPDGTMPGPGQDEARLPAPPRLAVVYGREDGQGFSLAGAPGTVWRLGRSAPCEVRLDHDPYASSANSAVERTADGYVLSDLPGNRNGTWLNWSRIPSGRSVPLQSGDVVTVGRTHLAFKA